MAWWWWIILTVIGWVMVSFGIAPWVGPWVAKRIHIKGGEPEWTNGESGTGSTGAGTTE